MAKHISNMNELQKALQPVMKGMVDTLAERVYETLNYFLQEYYDDYDPKSYRRQYDFLRSAVKVESKTKGNKVVASVYIDTDSMDNYYNATGVQVARWANQGLHGGQGADPLKIPAVGGVEGGVLLLEQLGLQAGGLGLGHQDGARPLHAEIRDPLALQPGEDAGGLLGGGAGDQGGIGPGVEKDHQAHREDYQGR